jgi:predicted DNA binding CopG/RHH family protein
MSRRRAGTTKKFHDAEERALIARIERADARGELRPVKREKGIKAELQAAARAWMTTERKVARINIRLRPSDLVALKERAAQEGLAYQTLVASLIHKYVSLPPAAPSAPAATSKRRLA